MGLFEYMVALVIFLVAMTGLVTGFTSIAENYGISPTGPINASYNDINETEKTGFRIFEDIDSGEIESTSTDFGIVRGSVGAIKQTYDAYNTTKALSEKIQKEYGIPMIYFTGFSAIALLSIVFSVVYMVFRFKG